MTPTRRATRRRRLGGLIGHPVLERAGAPAGRWARPAEASRWRPSLIGEGGTVLGRSSPGRRPSRRARRNRANRSTPSAVHPGRRGRACPCAARRRSMVASGREEAEPQGIGSEALRCRSSSARRRSGISRMSRSGRFVSSGRRISLCEDTRRTESAERYGPGVAPRLDRHTGRRVRRMRRSRWADRIVLETMPDCPE
jgi:hypothetical protein